MAYNKTTWVDRNIEFPGRYLETDNGGGLKTFTPSPGTVTQSGTQFTASRANNIETGIENVYKGTHIYGASSTGNDSYAITFSPAFTSLVAGTSFNFKVDVANTGAATLQIDSIPAKALKKMTIAGKVALETGDIVANGIYNVLYDGTDFIVTNPTSILASVFTTQGDIPYASAANTITRLAKGTVGQSLLMNSDATSPEWGILKTVQDNGRYVTQYGFENATLSGVSVTNGVASLSYLTGNLGNVITPITDWQLMSDRWLAQNFSAGVAVASGTVVKATVALAKNGSPPAALTITLCTNNQSTSVGSTTISASSLTNTMNYYTVDITLTGNITLSQSCYLKFSTTLDASNYYKVAQLVGGGGGTYSTNSGSSWSSLGGSQLYAVVSAPAISGTITETITPADLDTWGNYKITCANDTANNAATVTIKSTADATLIGATTLANGANVIDCSALSVSTYPALKVITTLTRDTMATTSLSLSNASLSWEGRSPGKGLWEVISDTIMPADASSIVFSNLSAAYRAFRIEFIAVSTTASGATYLNMTFNATSSGYDYRYSENVGGATWTGAGSTNQAAIKLGSNTLSDQSWGDNLTSGEILIENTTTNQRKHARFNYMADNAVGSGLFSTGMGICYTKDLISTITLAASANNIKAGSRFIVWGCK